MTGSEAVDIVVVALASGTVGALEVTERFTDEPLKALRTIPAAVYVAVNVAAGIVALLLIRLVGLEFSATTDVEVQRWAQVIVAGIGAVVILRSVVFVSPGDGRTFGIGGLIERLLMQTEIHIARKRGPDRVQVVEDAAEGLTYAQAQTALGAIALSVVRNASDAASQELAQAQKSIEDSGETDGVKLWMLCSAVLNFGGEETLRKSAEQLRELSEGSAGAPHAEPPVKPPPAKARQGS